MIKQNVSLKNLNTFGLDAKCKYFYRWEDLNQQPEILQLIKTHPNYFILGGGSNTIFLKDFDGLVIQIALTGISATYNNDGTISVIVAAGENWHDFTQYALSQNWFGLENLSLIPGTVGATPVQNIGAYGVEVSDFINRVFILDTKTGENFNLSNQECQFSYRNSIFKQPENKHLIITKVEFKLQQNFTAKTNYGDLDIIAKQKATQDNLPLNANHIAQAVIEIRQSKLPDPKITGNVGSFFHNPIIDKSLLHALQQQYPQIPYYDYDKNKVKIAAGWLIDKAGLKGYQQQNVAVHDKQALILINKGNATANDVLDLQHTIEQTVKNKFNIELHPEPVFV